MNRQIVHEDHGFYTKPSWRYRLSRFIFASEIPFALVATASIFLAAACFMAFFFMVTR